MGRRMELKASRTRDHRAARKARAPRPLDPHAMSLTVSSMAWSACRELIYWQGCCNALFVEPRLTSALAGIRAGKCNAKSSLRPGSSVVERGPEKAGVGGSIPSLATTTPSKPVQGSLNQAKVLNKSLFFRLPFSVPAHAGSLTAPLCWGQQWLQKLIEPRRSEETLATRRAPLRHLGMNFSRWVSA